MNKTEIEETLKSIDATLDRIEKILIDQTRPTEISIEIPDGKKGKMERESGKSNKGW